MNESDQPNKQASFVVRLWLESAGGKAHWRGHVRHVQGPGEAHFEDVNHLLAFIEERAGVPLPLRTNAH